MKSTKNPRSFWQRWVWGDFTLQRFMVSLLVFYAALCFFGLFLSERLIFVPRPSSYVDTPTTLKLTIAGGGQISARYLPRPGALYTLLHSHGNAEDLGDVDGFLELMREQGLSVLGYDYPGYGTSEGIPSEAGAYTAIEAAYAYLTQTLKVSPERIILHGRSVGSGPSVDLASRQTVAALILESPFITAFRVVTRIAIVPFDKFDNLGKIRRVQVPLLILHGTADQVIPLWHGQKLHDRANPPKTFVPLAGAGHNDVLYVAGEEYLKALQQFLQQLPLNRSLD